MESGLMRFADRRDAGRRLADVLSARPGEPPVVLGLARGGVPVAYEVARELEAPLDVLVARKIGAPGHREFAIGAVAPDATYLTEDTIAALGIPAEYVQQEVERQQAAIAKRQLRYRRGAPAVSIAHRTVILVDDGIATGSTMIAAIQSARARNASHITVAAPVCAAQTVPHLRELADELVFLETPEAFRAVGLWYRDFSPTADDEVRTLLERANAEHEARSHPIGLGDTRF